MTTTPASDDDWTIHSINIHGVFFERWCRQVASNVPGWKFVSANYPVEFPPSNGSSRGALSALDLRIEMQQGDVRYTALIECKKNNPDLANWVFFSKSSPVDRWTVYSLDVNAHHQPKSGWHVRTNYNWLSMPNLVPFTDDARETRRYYSEYVKGGRDKSKATKTSNAAIQDASYQIALATQFVYFEEAQFADALGSHTYSQQPGWLAQMFIPMVVTTAHLYVCEFNPSDIDPDTGEIPYSKVTLTEQPAVMYEYPLPRPLQHSHANLADAIINDTLETVVRMPIMIVHSANLSDVLSWFP